MSVKRCPVSTPAPISYITCRPAEQAGEHHTHIMGEWLTHLVRLVRLMHPRVLLRLVDREVQDVHVFRDHARVHAFHEELALRVLLWSELRDHLAVKV